MKKKMKMLCAASLAIVMAAGAPAASYAAPLSPVPLATPEVTSDVITVQRHREQRRVQRHHRPPQGHRRHRNDNIVPLIGGLAAGALVLGAIEAERQRERERLYREREIYYDDDAHIAWCLQRYRSYDVYSDTYQPYQGPRRLCISPYS